ncbi:MAG TPA: biotin/lipoyl-containing protein [Armatimonadota bacterium]|nr:biotin/lipoyl-containing protein [Armatimonadota bacterium]
MEIDDIERLIGIIRGARISELAVSSGGVKIRLRKQLGGVAAAHAPVTRAEEVPLPAVEPQPAEEPAPAAAYITAPMVGIFHSMDAVGAAGAPASAGQVVGVIESMKLMNDIVSEHDGTIIEVLVEDGAPVEYGQHLFRVEPAHPGGEDAG